MKPKQLPKSFAMKDKEMPYYYNDNFICNLHMIIHRSLIKDSSKYCCATRNIQRDFMKIYDNHITKNVENCYEKTNKIIDCSYGLCRCYYSNTSKKEIYIMEHYSKFLEDKYLYCNNELTLAFTEDNLIVACILNNKNIHEYRA